MHVVGVLLSGHTQPCESVGSAQKDHAYFRLKNFAPLIRSRPYLAPIYAPTLSRNTQPNQRLNWSSSRVVVKSSGAHIKAASVRRLTKPEPLTVEMMAELVTERAQERSERRHLLPHCCLRPNANQSGSGRIIAERSVAQPPSRTRRGREASARTSGFETP